MGLLCFVDQDLFTERNPGVTCITWHPSALSFAVGCTFEVLSSFSQSLATDSDLPILQMRTDASPCGPLRTLTSP